MTPLDTCPLARYARRQRHARLRHYRRTRAEHEDAWLPMLFELRMLEVLLHRCSHLANSLSPGEIAATLLD